MKKFSKSNFSCECSFLSLSIDLIMSDNIKVVSLQSEVKQHEAGMAQRENRLAKLKQKNPSSGRTKTIKALQDEISMDKATIFNKKRLIKGKLLLTLLMHYSLDELHSFTFAFILSLLIFTIRLW